MNLEQIDHLALSCNNLEKSKQWYVDVLGFEQIYVDEWNGIPIFLRLGSTSIALFPDTHTSKLQPNQSKGISHFALKAGTQSDFLQAQDELHSHEIEYVFQDHDISHSIYFNDPDGHRVEITTYDVG